MKKLIDLVLYGNYWIALAGLAMCVQTDYLISGQIRCTPYALFVGCGTLALYALHRTIGIRKLAAFKNHGRYQIIAKYRHHILIYAGIAAVVGSCLFFGFAQKTQLALILPAVLGLGYVLPLFGKGRRLRDLHYIKIFLIAAVWAITTAWLPALYLGFDGLLPAYLLCLERFFFIFAITVPFDIRDLDVDQHTQVRTLPQRIGIKGSRILIVLLGGLTLAASIWLWQWQYYNTGQLMAVGLSTLLAVYFSVNASSRKHDYYFTGLIDGMMILQTLLVLFTGLFH